MEKQRTQEWFDKRRGRVTGSNVGAILGLNPYKTADDVLREMVRAYHGAEREFQGNAATEWGSYNEAGAQVEYEMESGNKVEETGFHVHPEYDWLGASPDGLVGEFGVVEIKCPYGQRDKNPPKFKTAHEQPHYWAQMQIEMACTGRKFCDFYQWAPADTSYSTVMLSESWLDENIPKLAEFHERYLSELDNPDHLMPKRAEVNTLEAQRLIEEHDDLSDAIERAQERKKEVMQRLVDIAKDRNALMFGRKLTKVEKKGSVSYAKVVKDHCPDVDLEEYRGKSSHHWKLS